MQRQHDGSISRETTLNPGSPPGISSRNNAVESGDQECGRLEENETALGQVAHVARVSRVFLVQQARWQVDGESLHGLVARGKVVESQRAHG